MLNINSLALECGTGWHVSVVSKRLLCVAFRAVHSERATGRQHRLAPQAATPNRSMVAARAGGPLLPRLYILYLQKLRNMLTCPTSLTLSWSSYDSATPASRTTQPGRTKICPALGRNGHPLGPQPHRRPAPRPAFHLPAPASRRRNLHHPRRRTLQC